MLTIHLFIISRVSRQDKPNTSAVQGEGVDQGEVVVVVEGSVHVMSRRRCGAVRGGAARQQAEQRALPLVTGYQTEGRPACPAATAFFCIAIFAPSSINQLPTTAAFTFFVCNAAGVNMVPEAERDDGAEGGDNRCRSPRGAGGERSWWAMCGLVAD